MTDEIIEMFLVTSAFTLGVTFPFMIYILLANLRSFWNATAESFRHRRDRRKADSIVNGSWLYHGSHQCPNGSMRVITILNIDTKDKIDIAFDRDILTKEAENFN